MEVQSPSQAMTQCKLCHTVIPQKPIAMIFHMEEYHDDRVYQEIDLASQQEFIRLIKEEIQKDEDHPDYNIVIDESDAEITRQFASHLSQLSPETFRNLLCDTPSKESVNKPVKQGSIAKSIAPDSTNQRSGLAGSAVRVEVENLSSEAKEQDSLPNALIDQLLEYALDAANEKDSSPKPVAKSLSRDTKEKSLSPVSEINASNQSQDSEVKALSVGQDSVINTLNVDEDSATQTVNMGRDSEISTLEQQVPLTPPETVELEETNNSGDSLNFVAKNLARDLVETMPGSPQNSTAELQETTGPGSPPAGVHSKTMSGSPESCAGDREETSGPGSSQNSTGDLQKTTGPGQPQNSADVHGKTVLGSPKNSAGDREETSGPESPQNSAGVHTKTVPGSPENSAGHREETSLPESLQNSAGLHTKTVPGSPENSTGHRRETLEPGSHQNGGVVPKNDVSLSSEKGSGDHGEASGPGSLQNGASPSRPYEKILPGSPQNSADEHEKTTTSLQNNLGNCDKMVPVSPENGTGEHEQTATGSPQNCYCEPERLQNSTGMHRTTVPVSPQNSTGKHDKTVLRSPQKGTVEHEKVMPASPQNRAGKHEKTVLGSPQDSIDKLEKPVPAPPQNSTGTDEKTVPLMLQNRTVEHKNVDLQLSELSESPSARRPQNVGHVAPTDFPTLSGKSEGHSSTEDIKKPKKWTCEHCHKEFVCLILDAYHHIEKCMEKNSPSNIVTLDKRYPQFSEILSTDSESEDEMKENLVIDELPSRGRREERQESEKQNKNDTSKNAALDMRHPQFSDISSADPESDDEMKENLVIDERPDPDRNDTSNLLSEPLYIVVNLTKVSGTSTNSADDSSNAGGCSVVPLASQEFIPSTRLGNNLAANTETASQSIPAESGVNFQDDTNRDKFVEPTSKLRANKEIPAIDNEIIASLSEVAAAVAKSVEKPVQNIEKLLMDSPRTVQINSTWKPNVVSEASSSESNQTVSSPLIIPTRKSSVRSSYSATRMAKRLSNAQKNNQDKTDATHTTPVVPIPSQTSKQSAPKQRAAAVKANGNKMAAIKRSISHKDKYVSAIAKADKRTKSTSEKAPEKRKRRSKSFETAPKKRGRKRRKTSIEEQPVETAFVDSPPSVDDVSVNDNPPIASDSGSDLHNDDFQSSASRNARNSSDVANARNIAYVNLSSSSYAANQPCKNTSYSKHTVSSPNQASENANHSRYAVDVADEDTSNSSYAANAPNQASGNLSSFRYTANARNLAYKNASNTSYAANASNRASENSDYSRSTANAPNLAHGNASNSSCAKNSPNLASESSSYSRYTASASNLALGNVSNSSYAANASNRASESSSYSRYAANAPNLSHENARYSSYAANAASTARGSASNSAANVANKAHDNASNSEVIVIDSDSSDEEEEYPTNYVGYRRDEVLRHFNENSMQDKEERPPQDNSLKVVSVKSLSPDNSSLEISREANSDQERFTEEIIGEYGADAVNSHTETQTSEFENSGQQCTTTNDSNSPVSDDFMPSDHPETVEYNPPSQLQQSDSPLDAGCVSEAGDDDFIDDIPRLSPRKAKTGKRKRSVSAEKKSPKKRRGRKKTVKNVKRKRLIVSTSESDSQGVDSPKNLTKNVGKQTSVWEDLCFNSTQSRGTTLNAEVEIASTVSTPECSTAYDSSSNFEQQEDPFDEPFVDLGTACELNDDNSDMTSPSSEITISPDLGLLEEQKAAELCGTQNEDVVPRYPKKATARKSLKPSSKPASPRTVKVKKCIECNAIVPDSPQSFSSHRQECENARFGNC